MSNQFAINHKASGFLSGTLTRILLVLLGVGGALVLAELELRIVAPDAAFGAARELTHFQKPEHSQQFEIDADFGFRPVLGRGCYNKFGTLTNSYALAKPAGVMRLLFVGDSVTARGQLVAALRKCYGEEKFEYWNAGVESFNTIQEVEYYKRYNSAIQPDHVILTFHMNDFETTPVVFRRADGRLAAYAPNCPLRSINPALFRYSRLYRCWVGTFRCGSGQIDEIVRETRQSLAELKQLTERQGVRLTVLVLPLFKPEEEWTPQDRFTRQLALNILSDLGIRHFDLYEETMTAIREGVSATEIPGDAWHPSREVAERLAQYLWKQNLL